MSFGTVIVCEKKKRFRYTAKPKLQQMFHMKTT